MDELICRSFKGRTTREEDDRLLAWRGVSSTNEAYYQELARLLEAAEFVVLDEASPAPPPVAALIRRAERDASLAERWGSRWTRTGWAWGSGVAIAAAITVVLLGIVRPDAGARQEFSFGTGEFVTGPTETATVVLGDGTVVRLAPESRLRIPGVSGAREVFLDGRAYFAVAKMEKYPFRVRTQAGEAVVLGTRFEIRADGEDLRLVVLEGRVALGAGGTEVVVGGGEMSVVSRGTTSAPARIEDVKPLVSWLERFIVFQSTPLSEVARELEREYGIPVEVTDSALARHTITGWYADRKFEEVLNIVCGVLQADCSIGDGVARIEPARNEPPTSP